MTFDVCAEVLYKRYDMPRDFVEGLYAKWLEWTYGDVCDFYRDACSWFTDGNAPYFDRWLARQYPHGSM